MFPALVSVATVAIAMAFTRGPVRHTHTDVAVHTGASEIARIRAHFDSVLAELPSATPYTLSAPQRTKRAQLITTLRVYRDAGVFPHNYDFPTQPTPYFVDRRTGTLCAVAHLLASTGRRDIVDRVAAQNNNVWVADLAADTAFTGWLRTHGLTLDDAARIQMPYVIDGPGAEGAAPRTTAYTASSAIILGSSLTASLLSTRHNSDGHRSMTNVVGAVASVFSLGLAASALADPAAPRYVAPVSFLTGGLGALIATRGIVRHRAYVAARQEAQRRVAVAPLLPVAGVSGAGLTVQLRF
jgi:hypothetical protein